jgi:mannose-6-phosphate isomerase-like protein (cupin superfamily)
MRFESLFLPEEYELAPDGSQVRPLLSYAEGSLAHCILPEGCVSIPIKHHTVSEIWYFIEGEGEIWRKLGENEGIVEVKTDVSITIPTNTCFQFRNTGSGPLKFLCFTMPKWPGDHEANTVKGPWTSTLS